MANDLFYHVALDAGSVDYDLSDDISTLTIDESANQPASVVITMSDPFKVYSHAFQEGMELTVDLGDVKDHSIIFRGQIYKVEEDFPKDGVPRLTLHSNDHSMKMGLRKRNRSWKDMQLSDIVRRIASNDHGFSRTEIKVLGDPLFSDNGIRQQDETDLAFLLRLAAVYGCEIFVRADDQGEVFHFVDQKDIMKAKPPITLYYGRCDVENRLLSFAPNADVSNIQLPRVYSGMEYSTGKPIDPITAQVEDVAKDDDAFLDENLAEFRKKYPKKAEQIKALITAAKDVQKAVRKDLGDTRRETVEGHSTPDDLRQRAKNQFSASIMGMRANGTAPGIKNLHAQANVGIADVGGRFSGLWYVSSVKHALNNQGYKCSFECKR